MADWLTVPHHTPPHTTPHHTSSHTAPQPCTHRYDNVKGDYSELLSASIFCLVIAGDGWSARMDDATLHGCIPVIIMDEVDVSFESVVDLAWEPRAWPVGVHPDAAPTPRSRRQ